MRHNMVKYEFNVHNDFLCMSAFFLNPGKKLLLQWEWMNV